MIVYAYEVLKENAPKKKLKKRIVNIFGPLGVIEIYTRIMSQSP